MLLTHSSLYSKMASRGVNFCVLNLYLQEVKQREYVPAYRSGSYALIIALYRGREVHTVTAVVTFDGIYYSLIFRSHLGKVTVLKLN